ncbi:MAG TPA: ABC transporter permease [Puia sp.]|nr:ABC transporter permease [Puia sp.]
MLKNYLRIALRNLTRNRLSSAINIGGLAIGMAVAILISLWIYNETSFNHQYRNHGRIAAVLQKQPGRTGHAVGQLRWSAQSL